MVRLEKRSLPVTWSSVFQENNEVNRWTLRPYQVKRHHESNRRCPFFLLAIIMWAVGTVILHRAFLSGPRIIRLSMSSTLPPSIETLIKSSSSTVLILCDDCVDLKKTSHWNALSKYSWAYPLIIPLVSISSPHLEISSRINEMKSMFYHLANVSTDTSDSWVGSFFISSTFDSYLNITLVDEMLTDESLKYRDDIHVLAFGNITRPDESLTMRLDDHLPGMYDILRYILLQMGEDPADITSIDLLSPGFKAFHGSLFVTRVNLLHSYAHWLESLVNVLESDMNIRSMMRTSYRRIYRRSIDQFLFPFLFRRDSSQDPPMRSLAECLASYFFHKNNMKVITAAEYSSNKRLEKQVREEKTLADEFNFKTVRKIGLTNVPHLFILAHDNETAHKANHTFSNYTWALPYIIPRTYYFETYFYSHLMNDLLKIVHKETPWIGSISWKADKKSNITLINMMISDFAVTGQYDVLVFWNPEPKKTLWEQQVGCHPPIFWDLIDYTLSSMGESSHLISRMRLKQPHFKTFYGSYFVTKPQHMRKYIHWISRVIHFLETDRKAQNMLWRDSHYRGDMKVARVVYNLPFYPLHAFLGERLVQYFFNTRGAQILTADEYVSLKKKL